MTLTATEPGTRRAECSLPYGDLAIALYAAITLPAAPSHTPDIAQLSDYAKEGARTLGGVERVHALHDELLRLNQRLLRGSLTAEDYEAEVISWLQSAIPQRRPDTARLRWCESADFGRLRPTQT